jgi:hypothetical protein
MASGYVFSASQMGLHMPPRNECDSTLQYESVQYPVGEIFRYLKSRRQNLSADTKEILKSIEVRNAKLKPKTKAEVRAKEKKKKNAPTKSSSRLTKQRESKLELLIQQDHAKETSLIGLRTCRAICSRDHYRANKYFCADVNLVTSRCKIHEPKCWEKLTLYDLEDTALTSKQNTHLAPSNLLDASLGVFSNTTLRKDAYAALYGVQCIVSRAEYERDYKGTGRIECDYTFEISTDEIAIGLTKPVAGEGLESFLNSSYRNKQYPNNCKFVVHGQSVVVILDNEALPIHQELLVPYNRPL